MKLFTTRVGGFVTRTSVQRTGTHSLDKLSPASARRETAGSFITWSGRDNARNGLFFASYQEKVRRTATTLISSPQSDSSSRWNLSYQQTLLALRSVCVAESTREFQCTRGSRSRLSANKAFTPSIAARSPVAGLPGSDCDVDKKICDSDYMRIPAGHPFSPRDY